VLTQFSPTPPEMQSVGMPVVRYTCRPQSSMISSVTALDRCREIHLRCVSGASGSRGGPPNTASNAEVMVSPSQQLK
jgi:hypothetical protein